MLSFARSARSGGDGQLGLSMAICRAAARVVRRAPHGRQAIDSVRPVGGVGILRQRAPIALAMYVAARDGLVVYLGPDAFALLQSPVRQTPRRFAGGHRYGWLRLLDRDWGIIAPYAPVVPPLLTAVALAPFRSLAPVAILILLAVMVYVVAVMAGGLLRVLVRALTRRRTDGDLAAEMLPSSNWSVPLLHVVDAAAVPDMLRQVETRVRAQVRAAVRAASEALDARTDTVRSRAVVVPRRGITTEAARDAVTTAGVHRYGDDADVVLLVPRDHDGRPAEPPIAASAGFLAWYAFSIVLAIGWCAISVARSERAACVTDCAGRPATFGAALRWLAQRLWFTDPPDLSPATTQGVVIGWLVSALSAVTILVIVAAIQVTVRRQRQVHRTLVWTLIRLTDVRIVLFTALEVEYNAVKAHLEGPFTVRAEMGTLYEVGAFHGKPVAIVQTGPGNSRAAIEVERARTVFAPRVLVFVGVAGGRKGVERGDVVAADVVYDYESGKVDATGFRPRFKTFPSAHGLVQLARHVARSDTWQCRILAVEPMKSPRAYVKPLAAGAKLIADDESTIAAVLTQNCGDALAVEMEGYGFLQAAHAVENAEAIVVRGISDLLRGKSAPADEQWQPIAAAHAAAFTFEMLVGVDV